MVSAPPMALTSMVSTLSRSIVMLATSRVSRACPPLAEMSMFSLTLAPLNTSVSVPAWPSTVSLPSPGFQTNVSLPAPSRAVSLPCAANDEVVALAADDLVIAGAAIDREVDLAGLEGGGVDGVVAGEAVDRERVEGALGAGERHLRRQSVDHHARAAAGDRDGVVAGRAVDDHVVRRPVTLAAAHRARQVDVDLLGVGSGEVVDRDRVGAAQGVDLDVLDTVEVHGDVGDVAEQPHPAAIGRDVHVLGDVCAVEHQRIGAGLALDDVAAVAGVPGERIVAVAEESRVGAATADHGVVAVTADAACRRPGCR